MSAYQSNSSLARTRSLRTTTKSTLTAPQASAPLLSKLPQIPTCTSNVLLFLTNSRLLDLDHEPDWPDITPTTFSARDALGGQKKRIQCVEWALYQLFCLWDHNEAQNKLRPFYPPADQVQSINLRAALVRSLEAAKRNGVLGRDVLIRKTMLDECKGERLEEVLAVFSSAVLKKQVAERALNSGLEYRPTVSESISLENWGYTGDRTELNGLLLAHKVSLKSILRKKGTARQKYRDFAELLAMKERGLSRRREQAKHTAQDKAIEIPDTDKAEVRRILRNHWTGNEQWVEGLLDSSSSQKRGLLSTPFNDVWRGVQTGNITDLEEHTTGLLEQLEQRVDHQKSRLRKWEDFRRDNFGDIRPKVTQNATPRPNQNETSFDFTAHLDLKFNDFASLSHPRSDDPPAEYVKILNRLTTELETFKSMEIPDFSCLINDTRRGPTRTASAQFTPPEPADEPVSDLSDWEDETEEVASQPNVRPTAIPRGFPATRRQLPVPRETRKTSPVRHGDATEAPREYKRSRAELYPTQVEQKRNARKDDQCTISDRYEESRTSSILNQPPIVKKTNDSMQPFSRPKSPTQLLADEILNSMNNTSPSPMKKSRYTLSLAERTRMSMARTTSFEPEDDSPQHSPVKSSHTQSNDEATTDNDLERGEEYDDLITRTRRSMAGFEAARQKAQLERRRSQRKSKVVQRKDSYFPKVEEETSGNLSVVEGLMEDGQDYEAIFKSRPRIATSPAPSPYRQSHAE
ncbi:HAUS augmin-like complex subunit 6 N-terminus-domain-containing protein [Xylaria bambusicola]|uniref:HAUS augmin-like complex subunit 6 N-terminus-domain-containing protein n=1 Tax=Xylaria bambusicola TaxID=326684 RepID=UPI002008D64F|nr:HAUS augmin-like complex subunit 6 N-terminus-domain-containing protein [Xylaria bambusicola]KAI0525881.1 HAUS augmin-like complex subunit 6 N-terminus-domain-containing protein [Xylaria bambusicola]